MFKRTLASVVLIFSLCGLVSAARISGALPFVYRAPGVRLLIEAAPSSSQKLIGQLVRASKSKRRSYDFEGRILKTSPDRSGNNRYRIMLRSSSGIVIRGVLRTEERFSGNIGHGYQIFEGFVSRPRLVRKSRSRVVLERIINTIILD